MRDDGIKFYVVSVEVAAIDEGHARGLVEGFLMLNPAIRRDRAMSVRSVRQLKRRARPQRETKGKA
jgi:hypothetical protein